MILVVYLVNLQLLLLVQVAAILVHALIAVSKGAVFAAALLMARIQRALIAAIDGVVYIGPE